MDIKLLKHGDMSLYDLENACRIKSKRWPHNFEECKGWMDENLFSEDLHLFINLENETVGYCNLVELNVFMNGFEQNFFGLGNVCTSASGRGYGNLVMQGVNQVLLNYACPGLLFCKDNLVSYYEKFAWQLVSPAKIETEKFKGINFMVLNMKKIITSLKYNGRNF